MATSASNSTGTSNSSSTPGLMNSPQSDWELQLAQYLQQVGTQQMQWAMQEYARAGRVTDAQINNYIQTAQQGSDLAGGMLGRYNNLYAPMTDQYAREAGTYASGPRLQHEMGRAESGVMQAGNAAKDNAEHELQAFGIDPSSGRYQDLVRASNTATAAAAVNAGETARRQVEQEGTRRKETAINMGQQLPGAAVNAMNSAYQGIAGAENSALGLANTGVNLTTSPSKFFDPAMQLKYPPVGNTSQQRSQQAAQQAAGGPGGGGQRDPSGGGNRSGGGNDGGGSWGSGAGNAPVYSNPNGNFSSASPRVREQEQDNGQAPGGAYDTQPWNSPEAQQDPYSWGGQGGPGILPDAYGPDPWNAGQTPPADYGAWDNSGWQNGGDLGSWSGGATQDWGTPAANWGDQQNASYQSDNGSSGFDDYYAGGGGVVPSSMSPSGGAQTDDVSATIPQTGGQAQINVGEFVIPKDVAMWKGQEFFQKMIAQSRKARMGAPAKPQRG